jgi:hypothetical protein
MEAVDILGRVDPEKNGIIVQTGRQGKLYQDSVNGRIPVQVIDKPQQFFPGNVRVEIDVRGVNADFLASGALVPDIGFAGGILADKDHGQTRGTAFFPDKLGNLLFLFFEERL